MAYKIKMECNGLEELQIKLKGNCNLTPFKDVVRINGRELDEKIKRNAEFKGHFEGNKFVKPTGTTKKSINLSIEDGGLTAKTGPTTEYAPYVEKGTRRMAAQPFVRPAFNEQKEIFKKDLKKLVR